MTDIIVIGGGVVGLTTALCLARAFPRATISVWRETRGQSPPHAIWEVPPYRVEPEDDAMRWAIASLDVFLDLVPSNIGVSMETYYMVSRHSGRITEMLAKVDAVTRQRIDMRDTPHELNALLGPGYQQVTRFKVPVIDSSRYLRWLERQLAQFGSRVSILQQRIDDLAIATHSPGVRSVIVCAGLGARALVPDESCHPVRGQVVSAVAPWIDCAIADMDTGAYVIPCPGRDLELGGTGTAHDWDRRPRESDTATILSIVGEMVPSLRGVTPTDTWTGFRPSRTTGVRLEATRLDGTQVVYNYGHGGSGYTCSWGAAQDVVRLVEEHWVVAKL